MHFIISLLREMKGIFEISYFCVTKARKIHLNKPIYRLLQANTRQLNSITLQPGPSKEGKIPQSCTQIVVETFNQTQTVIRDNKPVININY